MTERCLVDTNILLRFFTGEPPEMAERARELIAQADTGKLLLEISSLVVAEAIYTLESYYEMSKAEVCDKLLVFLRSRGIHAQESEVVLDALARYRSLPVHFADAYLAAQAVACDLPIYSFDEDFARFKDVNWKR